MSELEELPSWAGRSTGEAQTAAEAGGKSVLAGQAKQAAAMTQQMAAEQQAEPVVDQQRPRRRRPWMVALYALLGLLALFGMGAAGYFLANYEGSSETETAGEISADETDANNQLGSQELAEDESQAADEGDAVATDGDDAADAETDSDTVTVDVEDEAEEEAPAEEEPEPETEAETETAPADGEPERSAIFRGGKVYLQGSVPSEEIGAVIEGKAAAVVGPDNVVNEYVIDPDSVIVPGSSAPLYVEDVVLFEFNSIEVATPFLPILDLGTLLLRQNPQATITVVTRTDAVGSEEVNLDVATKRAQAVINYWLGKGVDPGQILADPKGEEGASEDDDEQTAALNRRAEFIITGLLD